MAEGKVPGSDGLTVAVLKKFWTELGDPLTECLLEGLERGELSASQKQSVIKLIAKQNKDLQELSGWRPISLMNVDVKILARAASERMRYPLSQLVSQNQIA